MKNHWLFVLFIAFALSGCVVEQPRYGDEERGERRGDRYVYCGGEHRLFVGDFDMDPDPIAEGQRIRVWRVRVRSDGNGECQTTLRIRERSDGDIVGRARVYYLRPGWNEIDFDPLETYRFRRREHCFEVIADIAGTSRPVDAERTFCARQNAGNRWSFR